MNILHITKYIGEQKKVFKGYDPLSNILEKPYIINRKADLFNIHLTFDVDKGTIRFDEPIPHHQETSHETYYYFGNNYGNNPQYYLVRELSKAYLFLEDIWTNLYKMLKKNHLTSSDLYNYLTIMKDKHLFIEIKDKNNRLKALKLNLELLPLPESYKGGKLEFHKEERSFLIDGKILSIGKYIALVNDANELHFTMIIPRLIMNQQSYILSQTKGYKELVKLKNHLTFSSHPKHNKRICYVCGQEKSDVDVSYTKKYTSINKLFITQKINYASQIDSKGHNDNYGMCNDCYEDLLNGEAEIENSFSTTIAGENVYILPEALLDIFSYDDLKKFKENVDIAFNEKKVVDWLKSIEANTLFNPHYTLNMIFYRKAQGSFVVLESIEDVPSLHLARLIESFKNEAWRYPTQNFSLGTIYHMIPVSKNNKDKQIDIKRVLSLYRMILSGYEIQLEYIFRLFT
ncbi:MAG: hypothetical protein IMW92_14510, partial [Bacillales bacterium]|nr:hypothetical protein [Bacillales bacterium]